MHKRIQSGENPVEVGRSFPTMARMQWSTFMSQPKAPPPDALKHFTKHCAAVKLLALFIDRFLRARTLAAVTVAMATYMYGPAALRVFHLVP